MAGFLVQLQHNSVVDERLSVALDVCRWVEVGARDGRGKSDFHGKGGKSGVSGGFTKCGQFLETHRSAGQFPHGPHQLVVGRMRVAHRRGKALMASESLGQADVLGCSKYAGARAMTKCMESKGAFEPGALLPSTHQRADLPCGESVTLLAHEKRRIRGHGLSCCAFPGGVLLELDSQPNRQDNLLHSGVGVAALEDSEHDAPSRLVVGVKHVAHVEGDNLVFSKASCQGKTDKHVVPKTGFVLSRCLEQLGLLALRESPRGNGDSRVMAHDRIHA